MCSIVIEWEGDTLELTRISRLDMGGYMCIASNGVPPAVSKLIKISVDCKSHIFSPFIIRTQNTALRNVGFQPCNTNIAIICKMRYRVNKEFAQEKYCIP